MATESSISTDYDGRTVMELPQNAHDAHSKEHSDGVILVDLREESKPSTEFSTSRTLGIRFGTRIVVPTRYEYKAA